jgi:hypothetical protein
LGIRAVALLATAVAGLIVGGILLGAYFETPEEASLRQPPVVVPVTDPVRTEVLERALNVRGTPAPAERGAPRFVAGTDGRIITSVGIQPGDVVDSGSVVVEVEGRPVIALTGAFPTWRDFSTSMDPGPDVAQLQAALAELGLFRDEINGSFGPTSLAAVTSLYRSTGYRPLSASVISHQELVFIPVDLRHVERVHAVVGDRLGSESITLSSGTRRIEVDLTVDQRQVVAPGATIRSATGSSNTGWAATIDEVISLDREDGTPGPNSAIVTREPIPEWMTGEQVFEVVLASTDRRVLSASPVAVHVNDEGHAFVVVLDGGDERVVPVTVGLVTDERVEIAPVVDGALSSGDQLVLNPQR